MSFLREETIKQWPQGGGSRAGLGEMSPGDGGILSQGDAQGSEAPLASWLVASLLKMSF